MRRHEVVRLVTPSGGGFGDPFDRDVDLVSADVRRELMSPEVARLFYGVIVDDAGVVDLPATEALRASRGRAHPLFTMGPARERIDRILPRPLRAAFAGLLLSHDKAVRQPLRIAVTARLLQDDVPATPALLDRLIAEELDRLART